MSSVVEVNYATEGLVDAAVAERLIRHCGGELGLRRVAGGKSKLDPRIANYVQSARRLPWLVVRDLDHDAACAAELRANLTNEVPDLMCLRIAVRQIESWLLSDRMAISEFLRVPVGRVPLQPEALDNAKLATVNLARHSASRRIRASLVPRTGSGATEGPEFAAMMVSFAQEHWRPERAAGLVEGSSLVRAINCLTRLIKAAEKLA